MHRKRRSPTPPVERAALHNAGPGVAPRTLWLAAAALCAIAAGVYANSFTAGFVLDSRPLILDDARVHAVTPGNLANILGHSYWWPLFETNLYRPVTTLSYLLNYAVLGNTNRPAGYHAVNLLLHLANVLLVFVLVRQLLNWPHGTGMKARSDEPAAAVVAPFLIAAVWAVHPLSTEAVTNIIGRADLLAAFGVLAALNGYVRLRERSGRGRILWMVCVMGATTLAVLSKESAVAVVFVAAALDAAFRVRSDSLATMARRWVLFAPPLLLLWALRSSALGSQPQPVPFVDNPIVGAGFLVGRLTAVAVVGRYIWLFVWPAHLSPDYSYNQIPLASGSPQDWLAWCTVALLLAGAVIAWRRSRFVSFAIIFFIATLMPAANLLFPTGTIMAERLMYLPSIGLAAASVAVVLAAAERWGRPVLAYALAAVAILALGAATWQRNPDWHSEVSLWSAAVQAAPRSFKTHGALAEALYDADPSHADLDEVIAEKERSLALLDGLDDPADVSNPYREAAVYYLEDGRYERAVDAAQRYLALAEPNGLAPAGDLSRTYLLLATAHARLGDIDEAVAAAHAATTREPFNPDVYRVGGAALSEAGRSDDAAILLMTGFIMTGQEDLRETVITLYRGGLDPDGCAVTSGPRGAVLDSTCPVVRRHLCGAADAAIPLQRAHGRGDLADQLTSTIVQPFGCGG